jgi:ubiquinone/menaquinone biosynthesis C-methylase UbiE
MELSTDKILSSALSLLAKNKPNLTGNYLDIGSGTGELIRHVKNKFNVDSYAVDYTDSLMELTDQAVDIVDLNNCNLPYEDNFFDGITFTEVIEHLEDHRKILKEVNRILKPGGVLVVSTPNILNMKSRVRFLTFGFYNLFGPLHVKDSDLHHAGGHINPLSYFYLSHSLLDADFEDIRLTIDKKQGTSLFWLSLFYPFILFVSFFTYRKEIKKYKTIDEHNEEFVRDINSIQCLTGRTIVVSAIKK